jgi:4-amino-4-deoxy-L-arabinose transferase-like glycosyltransferase
MAYSDSHETRRTCSFLHRSMRVASCNGVPRTSARAHLALAGIVALAAVLRLTALDSAPAGLNQDEAVNGYDAFCLGLTLRDHHGQLLPVMLQSFGDWVSPLLTYLTVPFVRLFDLSKVAIRLPVALLGIASVPLLYVLARRLFGRVDVGIVAAAILAISPWSIMLSRWAIPPSSVPFFVILFVLALVMLADALATSPRASVLRAVLAALSGAAVTYAYPPEKMFVPFLLAATIMLFLRKQRLASIVLVCVYLALVAPIAVLTLEDPARYNAHVAEVSLQGSVPHELAASVLRYVLYLSPIALFGSGDSDIQHHLPTFGSTFAFLAPFFYLGVVFVLASALRRPHAPVSTLSLVPHRSAILLLLWLALFPLPGSLTEAYMHVLRAVQGLPLIPIFAAAGIVGIADALALVPLRDALYGTLAVVAGFTSLDYMANYLTNYRDASKAAFQYGLREALTYVLPRQRLFREIVVDDAIREPYIYVLFYERRDPRTLKYAELEPHGERTVRRMRVFRFEPVDRTRLMHAHLIHAVRDDLGTWYRIYETREHTCLVERAQPAPTVSRVMDLPSKLKLLVSGARHQVDSGKQSFSARKRSDYERVEGP